MVQVVDNDRVEVWVRNTRGYEGKLYHSINWRSPRTGLGSQIMDHPITLAQALVWLGTKMQLDEANASSFTQTTLQGEQNV